MDPEVLSGMKWMLVGVFVPGILIYGVVGFTGFESDTFFEFVLTIIVTILSLIWALYCTWRIKTAGQTGNTPAEGIEAP